MAIKTKHKKNPGLKEALIGVFNELTGIEPHKKQRILEALKSPDIEISNKREHKLSIYRFFMTCYAGENMNPVDIKRLTAFAKEQLIVDKKPKLTPPKPSMRRSGF